MVNDFIIMLFFLDDVVVILKCSCYDCYFYKMKYFWYMSIVFFSWWIGYYIEEGWEYLNFFEWGKLMERWKKYKLEECWEEVEEGKMLLDFYLWVYGEVKFSEE